MKGKKGLNGHGEISHFKCLWEAEKDKTEAVAIGPGRCGSVD